MSRGNKWIPMDQYLAQDLKLIKGPFSRIEAMYSYTLDQDKGIKGTIAGYSVLWGWSRNKVRHFLNCIRTDEGHIRDRKRTHEGHPIHFIDRALMGKKDRSRTGTGQIADRLHDTTIHPNPKPNPNKRTISPEIIDFTEHFSDYVCKLNPNLKKPDLKKSADTVDKLIRLDGFTLDYIKKVLKWALKDDFWGGQVFSLAPLRSKSKNTLTKFQNIVNGFDSSGKVNGSKNNHNFDNVVYEGENEDEFLERFGGKDD